MMVTMVMMVTMSMMVIMRICTRPTPGLFVIGLRTPALMQNGKGDVVMVT